MGRGGTDGNATDPETVTPAERTRRIGAWLDRSREQATLWAKERDRTEWRVALSNALKRTRPWTDLRATQRALDDWWYAFLRSRLATYGPADIAEQLHGTDDFPGLGRALNLPPDVTDLVAGMVVNVANGRAPRDYAFLGQVSGKRTTLADYRKLRRDDDPLAPLRALMKRTQRQLDQSALVRAGWKLPAARRLLERHRGWHPAVVDGFIRWTPSPDASNTPPPRKRRP